MLKREDYLKIYALLDSVSPLQGDCGELCNSVCCRTELYSSPENYNLHMLLGEDVIHDKTDSWLTWHEEKPSDFFYPSSWGEVFYTVNCQGPDSCKRHMRPIQCRTFPLEPHLTPKGCLQLVYCHYKMPYKCPLICDKMKLNDDFIKTTYSAWEILITDRPIYEYVKKESRRHGLWRKKYAVVYSPK